MVVLQQYRASWTRLYEGDPPLENEAPKDFYENTQYTCAGPIPWFPCVKSSVSSQGPSSSLQCASTSHESHTPVLVPSPNSSPPLPHVSQDAGSSDGLLEQYLEQDHFKVSLTIPSACIGNLNPGYKEYLLSPSKKRLRVIFILVPQYELDSNPTLSATVSLEEIDLAAMIAIQQELPTCVVKNTSKEAHDGKVWCFLSSWVSLYLISL